MGKSSPSMPEMPDPAQLIAQQGESNKDTALWNSALNNVNQITPYGSLSYTLGSTNPVDGVSNFSASNNVPESTGSKYWRAPDGRLLDKNQVIQDVRSNAGGTYGGDGDFNSYAKNYGYEAFDNPSSPSSSSSGNGFSSDGLPQWTSEINLTPEAQAILDSQLRQQTRLGEIGEGYLDQVANSVDTPYSYDGLPQIFGSDDFGNAQGRAEEALYSRMNPQFDRDEEALRSRLINQGIGQGSEAYNTEMERFNQAKTDARQQAILTGQQYGSSLLNNSLATRNQAINEYDAQRKAPLNEYIGLTSGVQVQNPQFQSTGYQGAAPVDVAGITNNAYGQAMNAYNAQAARSNSGIGSLLGLAGTLGGSFLGGAGGEALGGKLFG